MTGMRRKQTSEPRKFTSKSLGKKPSIRFSWRVREQRCTTVSAKPQQTLRKEGASANVNHDPQPQTTIWLIDAPAIASDRPK